MTTDTALKIAGMGSTALWRMIREAAAAGDPAQNATPDSLREEALDALAAEVERLRADIAESVWHR